MATLKEYFSTDFGRWMTASADHSATFPPSTEKITFPVRVHEDMAAAAKFVSIYIPDAIDPVALAKIYVDDTSLALSVGTGALVLMSFGRLESQESNSDLVFTGRLFIYTERQIPKVEIEHFRQYCQSKDIKLVWRDKTYAAERGRYERPLAFICHDSRDKVEVAQDIASNLQAMQCPVWYDEYSLAIGDSLREAIEKGIKEASKCILILSPNFFANGGWTKAEFDSIYTREIIEQKHVMLPVWHNVTKQDVYNYSPRLADRVAVNTSVGMKEVVRRLQSILNQ